METREVAVVILPSRKTDEIHDVSMAVGVHVVEEDMLYLRQVGDSSFYKLKAGDTYLINDQSIDVIDMCEIRQLFTGKSQIWPTISRTDIKFSSCVSYSAPSEEIREKIDRIYHKWFT